MNNCLDHRVGLDVEVIPHRFVAQGGSVEGFGDEGDFDPVLVGAGIGVEVGDGQGDAVDGDGALGDHPLHHGGVEPDADSIAVGGIDRDDCADAVDVALDLVPVEGVADAEGVFEVDQIVGFPVA